jgi:hypothetical protein
MAQMQSGISGSKFQDKEKPMEVRRSNITAAKGIITFLLQKGISVFDLICSRRC